MKSALQLLLAALMVAAGVFHFLKPKGFLRATPAWVPAPLFMVYFTGVCELAGGIGLMVPLTQRAAAWALAIFYVCVFPANVNMAVNKIGFGRAPPPAWLLWARLPLQAVLIAWAFWFT